MLTTQRTAFVPSRLMSPQIFGKATRALEGTPYRPSARMRQALSSYGISTLYLDDTAKLIFTMAERASVFIENAEEGVPFGTNVRRVFHRNSVIAIQHENGLACVLADMGTLMRTSQVAFFLEDEDRAAREAAALVHEPLPIGVEIRARMHAVSLPNPNPSVSRK